MTRHITPKAIAVSLMLLSLLILASCGLLSNNRTPEPGAIEQAGSPPILAADITFKTSVSYTQALRFVTDLGLQPATGCERPEWISEGFKQDFNQPLGGSIPVVSTAAAAPLWLDRLKDDKDITQVWINPTNHCSNSPAALKWLPASLPVAQSGSYARVTFSNKTSYDTALDTTMTLGFRLANPCYEQQRAQDKKPTWTSMGQESSFAASRTLLLATTPSNATSWQQQLSTTTGVLKVEVLLTMAC